MSSDDIRKTDAGPFRYPGYGSMWTRRCDKCGCSIPSLGQRKINIGGGVKITVGQCCAPKPKNHRLGVA